MMCMIQHNGVHLSKNLKDWNITAVLDVEEVIQRN